MPRSGGNHLRGGIAADRALLDQLVQMRAEGADEIGNPKDAHATEAVVEEADRYDHALKEALDELVERYPPKGGATAYDLWGEGQAPYLVLMTLRGEGVGIWDGGWDSYYEPAELRRDSSGVRRFLEERLQRFADDTGGGSLENAFTDAAFETTGHGEGGNGSSNGYARNGGRDRAIHLGVPGTNQHRDVLVPYCEPGYQAFERGALVVKTTLPGEVDCSFCLKGMRHGERAASGASVVITQRNAQRPNTPRYCPKCGLGLARGQKDERDCPRCRDERAGRTGARFVIGGSGLEQPKTIWLGPSRFYFMGASDSPRAIVVTTVTDDRVYYREWPYTDKHPDGRERFMQRWIAEDLIAKGSRTWLTKTARRTREPLVAENLEKMLRGEPGEPVEIDKLVRETDYRDNRGLKPNPYIARGGCETTVMDPQGNPLRLKMVDCSWFYFYDNSWIPLDYYGGYGADVVGDRILVRRGPLVDPGRPR